METTPYAILVADGRALFREAMCAVLATEPDLRVVADVADSLKVVPEALRTRPDVAVLHADLPGCDGISTTRALRKAVPGCKVLTVADREDVSLIVEFLRAGANGYLTKQTPLRDLIEGVRAIRRGEMPMPPAMVSGVLERLLERSSNREEALRKVRRLTVRERQVLALLVAGGNNESVAERLFISRQTVRTHIQNVIVKLGVHSRLEAAMFVTHNEIADELVDPDL
jgi:Response regulator containing a CheY-like receiver domain and an HTH DNA-binding domain